MRPARLPLGAGHRTGLLRTLLLCVWVAALAGCKVELYSGLAERDGNDILALLAASGIVAEKVPGKDQIVTINVDESDVAAAIDILNRNGFPRDNFASLGDIFKKEGLISSPFEERIRYTYGLSQGIAETLTRIDGVIAARVHISIPQQKAYGSSTQQVPSASVFVKYQPDSGVDQDVAKIKLLVQNSVESLDYDKISVALFAARDLQGTTDTGPPLQTVLGVRITRDSMARLVMLAVTAGLVLLLLIGGAGYYLLRMRRAMSAPRSGG